MSDDIFIEQSKKLSHCLSEWEKIDKQFFLITNAGNHLIVYPVASYSFDYDAYSYYSSRMLFFVENFIEAVRDILSNQWVIDICKETNEKCWFPFPSKSLFYYFDAFVMSLSAFTDNAFYDKLPFADEYKTILNDESKGYSFKSRVSIIRNRSIHPDGAIIVEPKGAEIGRLVETKSEGLCVFDDGKLKIQHTLIDVKNNPQLYAEWKNRNKNFLQKAIEKNIPLNVSSHDLIELFLSISKDACDFFNTSNKLIADNKGLTKRNTGQWIYKTENCIITYDETFS